MSVLIEIIYINQWIFVLQFDQILPMEFTSQEEGAKSLDVKGCVLPKQVFAGMSFFLLQDTVDYVGKCYYNTQMYLVEVIKYLNIYIYKNSKHLQFCHV